MGVNRRPEIVMRPDEVSELIATSRSATLATNGHSGHPHIVAMWYAVVDDEIYFETKSKSQKAVNIRRDPRMTVMVERGDTYDQLRGVSIDGVAAFVEPAEPVYWDAAISMWERYNRPFSPADRPALEAMMHNRVLIHVIPSRYRSWDHRKLGLPTSIRRGTTATDESAI